MRKRNVLSLVQQGLLPLCKQHLPLTLARNNLEQSFSIKKLAKKNRTWPEPTDCSQRLGLSLSYMLRLILLVLVSFFFITLFDVICTLFYKDVCSAWVSGCFNSSPPITASYS
jgi:hypothetical protein